MPITLHANGEPLLKQSSSYSQFATNLLLSCPQTAMVVLLLPRLVTKYDVTYRCICAGNCVIHPDKYSKVRIIYKKILDLFDKEIVTEESNGRAYL